MAKKQFKAESKRLMDLMIHSIYTNKEIFLRELISNASDAMDKLHYRSLTDKTITLNPEEQVIKIALDSEKRTLTISDKGCGMTEEELEKNLGTIAQSGSFVFKEEHEKKKDIDIIGQFGVGFYSAFMVSSQVEVTTKAYGSNEAYQWVSSGVEGYTISKVEKDSYGTDIVLTLKEDTEEEQYSTYLESYTIQNLVRKYSDYITYPIQMDVEETNLKEENQTEPVFTTKTLNHLVPLWKRDKKEITEEEYNTFYSDKFFDYEKPQKVIHTSVEGLVSFQSLLYIPSHVPFNYYTKEYEKGLQLYSNGVLIMEKCSDLLPDYFSFVKGVVDSSDLSLNISREMLQQDKKVSLIASNLESKIKKELETMLEKNREDYETFFKAFGMQLKFGVYNQFGMKKDQLKDLLLFHTSEGMRFVTLKEYVERMNPSQDAIYYAIGETIDKIDLLPQVEQVKERNYEILYLTDYVDEFVVQTLMEYEGKKFINVSTSKLDLTSEEEKEELKKLNAENHELFEFMKEAIGEVKSVEFTQKLKKHPVCLVSEGEISVGMEKVINAMPTDEQIKADLTLEINQNHSIAKTIQELYKTDQEKLKSYSKILYAQARLIEGLPIENPTELSNLIIEQLN